MEKEPYSREVYEKTQKEAEQAKTKMAKLEEEAHEEAKEFDTRFTKTRAKEQEAKKEIEALRAEMGIKPEEEDQYKEALDQLRQELGFSPEKEIPTYDIEIGGKTKDELVGKLKAKNITITKWANDLLESKDFTTSKEVKNIRLVELTVGDLGFPNGATFDEMIKRTAELKVLGKCPAETGPNLRLQIQDKEWKTVTMEPITDSVGDPYVFCLDFDGEQLELDANYARPVDHWLSDYPLVWVLRKLES